MTQATKTSLQSGLPVLRMEVPGTRTFTALLAFDAGARSERPEENGIAHFLEHLVFKGGERYPSHRAISTTAERMGGELNAYTSHDLVAFHLTTRAESANEALDLLTDFVGRPALRPNEIDRERGVVVQEIARYDDQPSSVASMLIDQAAFGDHPLGRSVLGPAEHIERFSRDDISAFMMRRWSPDHGAAVLSGNLSHLDDTVVESSLSRLPERAVPARSDAAPEPVRRVVVKTDDTNQSHLRLYYPLVVNPSRLEETAAASVFAVLLGGSMGSRLFLEIRERLGLCYAIRAESHGPSDAYGLWISSGLDSSKAVEAYERICEMVDEIRSEGPTDEEVERAKAYAAGATVRAFENSSRVASYAARRAVLFPDRVANPDAAIDAIDAVTTHDVARVALECFPAGKPSVGCVGPHEESDFQ